MANIRIKDQTTDTALAAGDYVIVDNATEGTRKFDLGQKLVDIDDDFTDVRQDLAEYEQIFTADVGESVANWLDEHPEATTTVDYRITQKVFETVADMVADTMLEVGDKCKTLGYYTVNDGGGANYIIKESTGGISEECINGVAELLIDDILNIRQVGAKGDGSEDVGALINRYTDDYNILIPLGKFLVTTPIVLQNSLLGELSSVFTPSASDRVNYSTLVYGLTASGANLITMEAANKIITNLVVIMENSNSVTAIYDNASGGTTEIRNILIGNLRDGTGVRANHSVSTSRACFIENVNVMGDGYSNSMGFLFESTANDCKIENCLAKAVKIGIRLNSSLLRCSNCHIYTGKDSGKAAVGWWAETKCLMGRGNAIFVGSDMYLDSACNIIDLTEQSLARLSNVTIWADENTDDSNIGYLLAGSGRLSIDGGTMYTETNRYTSIYKYENINIALRDFQVIVPSSINFDDMESVNAILPITSVVKENEYNLSNDTTKYVEIIRATVTSNTAFRFLITTLNGNTCYVDIKYYNSTWTVTYTAVIGTVHLWYKVDGTCIKIFSFGQSWHNVKSLINSVHGQVYFYPLFATSENGAFPRLALGSSDGLTVIN